MNLFGTSGIRRLADRNLLDIAFKTGIALGQIHRDIVIARDTRTSGNAVKYALLSGLLSAGVTCHDAGLTPTPTLAINLKKTQIGIMITASHNPPEYNGIKIFNPDGSSFDSRQQIELEKIINQTQMTVSWDKMQSDCQLYPNAVENHIDHIMKDIPPLPPIKIVVDCGCGAASVITPNLLRRLGCEVIAINSHPSGFFPRNAEPTEANLGTLMSICRQLNAIGIAHDGDADRMMAVDEQGRFISGDKLMVILARHLKAKEIVTTIDASMVIEEMGFKTIRTPVGDTYVSEKLRRGGDFGGEPSGAWVFPTSSLCPDGIYTAAVTAVIAAGNSLSSLAGSIPQYPILRGSIANNGIDFTLIVRSLNGLGESAIDNSDGCKLIFSDGWLLCRPSGTEPRIRITAEANTEARVHDLYDRVVKTINKIK
jgi:phosphoglucosamine mutase